MENAREALRELLSMSAIVFSEMDSRGTLNSDWLLMFKRGIEKAKTALVLADEVIKKSTAESAPAPPPDPPSDLVGFPEKAAKVGCETCRLTSQYHIHKLDLGEECPSEAQRCPMCTECFTLTLRFMLNQDFA